MSAMGRQLLQRQQLCFAHGIQCAVLDVIYKKKNDEEESDEYVETRQTTEGEDTDSESESEEEGGFVVEQVFARTRNEYVYRDINLKNTIEKVRKIVKFFRSPTRSEILNNYIKEEQKKKGLVLDCKTRWSSLADMVTRFLELKDSVKKALIDLKNDITVSSSELDLLQELSLSLNIVKATVEALCQENANLLTAETALRFMVEKLQSTNSYTGDRLLEELKKRISRRRLSDLVCTLKYLHNPTKYYAEPESDFFPSPGNLAITNVISDIIVKHYIKTQDSDSEDDITLIELRQQQHNEASFITSGPEMTLKEQLQKNIDDTLSATHSSSSAYISDRVELLTAIRMQMALFDNGGSRQVYLKQAYEFLLCIPPTSVDCERVFSSTKYLCSHLRCSLNDDSLDALSFLRSHYQRKLI